MIGPQCVRAWRSAAAVNSAANAGQALGQALELFTVPVAKILEIVSGAGHPFLEDLYEPVRVSSISGKNFR